MLSINKRLYNLFSAKTFHQQRFYVSNFQSYILHVLDSYQGTENIKKTHEVLLMIWKPDASLNIGSCRHLIIKQEFINYYYNDDYC